MRFSSIVCQHLAALRALLVLTAIVGGGYPLFIWLAAQLPGLHDKANGSIVEAHGKQLGSSLIGQLFTDADGPDKASLLTLVCTRSSDVAKLDGVNGAWPFCTGKGVGAVLSVIGPRDAAGEVARPTQVISVNEPCDTTATPFLATYEGVRVQCAQAGQDYSAGQLVPIRGAATADPQVPGDAVTASGSGLDPDISPANTDGRALGFMGEPSVNVLGVNITLDQLRPGG